MIQSTLAIFAATPAGVSSAVSGFQSKARMPSGLLEPIKTRWRLACAKERHAAPVTETAAAVLRKVRREGSSMTRAIVADGTRHAPAKGKAENRERMVKGNIPQGLKGVRENRVKTAFG